MKKRTFFRLSILFGIVALGFTLVARDQAYRAMDMKAKRLEIAVIDHLGYTPDLEAVQLSRTSRVLYEVGLSLMILCAGCSLLAIARDESGWYSMPILLLMFDYMAWTLL